MLIDKIKSDQLEARKNRDTFKSQLLTTLLGEAEKIGKDDGNRKTTDEEVWAVAKKFMKNYDEVLKVPNLSEVDQLKINNEKQIVSAYLPVQMTEQQIQEIIGVLGLTDVGSIMKHFNANFKGQFDGKLVSQIAKSLS
jgi:uncharacterized protein YqeY